MPKKPKEPKLWEIAYKDYARGLKPAAIAKKYGVAVSTVKSWRVRHWLEMDKKPKVGPPYGSRNGTGPPGNQNARKHGLFSKWLPEETKELVGDIDVLDPLEVLWGNIRLQYAAIIRAQKIMHVKDEKDKTVEIIENGGSHSKTEIQQAWDKQANFLKAMSRAISTLNTLVRSYENLLHTNYDLATEEQKARIELLKAKIESNNLEEDERIVIINDLPTSN